MARYDLLLSKLLTAILDSEVGRPMSETISVIQKRVTTLRLFRHLVAAFKYQKHPDLRQ